MHCNKIGQPVVIISRKRLMAAGIVNSCAKEGKFKKRARKLGD